uniref:ATP-binding cassette sub-family H member 7 n=1 Tax=Diaphorina citri TaxID=121845 RepID=A0A410GHT8_DIACI|nr:ATP-binding cassette sub-family H member 7 [Diaphorina citri]
MDPVPPEAAISVRNVYKRHSKNAPYVLKGINLTVERNTIYGLLGASGCGKTTLLSCLVGRHLIDFGQIRVFIQNKKQLGHMPQQVALYTEFSIGEVVRYFGYLYEMTAQDIDKTYRALSKLLSLPEDGKVLCGELSGGQQRRVSLAITLLHNPDLLILDEPTAGTDPVLSSTIWNHLLGLTAQGKTVIVTTHYIEEARQADVIGLMREGVLLEESEPQSLLLRYSCSSLEEAFLYLCFRHSKEKAESKGNEDPPLTVQCSPVLHSPLVSNEYISWSRFKAQLLKQFIWIKRNLLVMSYVVFLPLICMYVFNCAVGLFPSPLRLALINEETNGHPPVSCSQSVDTGCNLTGPMSCRYMQKIEKIGKVELVQFNNMAEAREAVGHGKLWGTMQFTPNFTQSFLNRYEMGRDTEPLDIYHSNVYLSLDMTDFITSFYLQGLMYDSFRQFYGDFLEACGNHRNVSHSPPLRFETPVFGSFTASYSEFTAPAVICLIQFFLPLLFTTSAIIQDKLRGITERNLVSGVTVLEVTLSTILVQYLMLIIQTLVVEYIQYVLYDHPFHGDPWITFLLVYLQGICGTMFGILICFITKQEQLAGFGIMAASIPIMTLSGLIWPVQAQPDYLRYFSQMLPITCSIDAVRGLTIRGYPFSHPMVYMGFVSSICWSFVLVLWSYIQVKRNDGAP